MKQIVVVAPYFGANMVHALRAFANLEHTQLGVISQEPVAHLPLDLRAKLGGHYRVDDAQDAGQLAQAARSFVKEWGKVDKLIGYLEQLQVPLAEARDVLGLPGMGAATARNFRDKNRMKAVLANAGLPVARQRLIGGFDDVRSFIDQVGYPIIVKPVDGLGSRGTFRVENAQALSTALNQLMPTPSHPIQAEEFVRGEEHSFETVFVDGQPVWSSSTYYLPGPLQVMEHDWMQYCVLLPREEAPEHVKRFMPLNHASLKALGLVHGISHMEWFNRPQGGVISEVGARPPGANIMPLNSAAYEVDMWAKWARLEVHHEWEMPERKYAVGAAFLRGQGHGGVIRAVEGIESAQAQVKGMVWAHKLPTVGQLHSTHYEGDGWVILRHPDTQRVVDGLRTVVNTIRVVVGR